MSYQHLTENERYLIGHQHTDGRSIRQIAAAVERAPGNCPNILQVTLARAVACLSTSLPSTV